VESALLLLGEIIRPWGQRGEVKVLPYGDLRETMTGREGFTLEKEGRIRPQVLERFRFHKSFVILKFKDCSDYEGAEALRGWKVGIPRGSAPAPPPDTYYHYDIIGLRVIFRQEARGRITEIWSTPGNDVYLIQDKGREWLLPATKEIVRRIDLEKGEMHVELPEGLMDLEEV
jgi:16S rRNA processing protein RimM